MGLFLNISKCVVWARSVPVEEARRLYPKGVKIVTDGVAFDEEKTILAKLLGSPFGSDAQVARETKQMVDRMLPRLLRVASMAHTHLAYALLRYCCNTRCVHLLRLVPPHLVADAAQEGLEAPFRLFYGFGL